MDPNATDMKNNRISRDIGLGAYCNRWIAGLLMVMGLVVASLTVPCNAQVTPSHSQEVYTTVDQMPRFPGGETALMTFIRDHISYPTEAADKNIQGKVVVQFVVDSTGQVGDVRVVRSVDANLDREAVRVIQSLPRFTAGTSMGRPVNVWYTLPVNFKLNNDISYLLSFIHDVDSIQIDYCNLDITAPRAITPADYDAGQFSPSRKTVVIKKKWKIREMVNAMGGLAKLSQGHLDTRGKITLYQRDGNKRVAYYDQFSLYYRGNYYDITTFTAAGARLREVLFPLIGQTE